MLTLQVKLLIIKLTFLRFPATIMEKFGKYYSL